MIENGKMRQLTKKQEYKLFLDKNKWTPIYIQDWYLDLVCGSQCWDVSIAKKGDEIVGIIPYFLRTNRFFQWIAMPPLSKLHGPYISPKYNNKKHHHSITESLIKSLPKIDYYQQGLGYHFKNWLPYLWKGYEQVTLYSYVFQTINLDSIYTQMDPDCRRRVIRAEDHLKVAFDTSFDVFFNVLCKTYERQKLRMPFAYDFLFNYYHELSRRSLCQIISIKDLNKVVSVCLLIWDNNCAYYLLEGTDHNSENRNAGILIKWAAIKFAKNELNLDRFDFEGSISSRIEKIYREFGAEATPYFVIKRYNSKFFLLLKFIQNYRQYGKLVQW